MSGLKDAVVTRPERKSVIVDKMFYEKKTLKLISDVNKFKELNENPTFTREGQLQCFFKKMKDKG